MGKYIWIYFSLFAATVLFTSALPAVQEPYLVPNSKWCWNKCGKKGGSCPTICGKGGYCCKKGANTCPKYLADLNTLDAYACIRDPTEAVTTIVPPTEPYLVPNSKCWNKCGSKGGSCPTFCGKGGYCCKKGAKTCPKDLADLNTLGVYACIRVPTGAATTAPPTEPYLVPNSKWCFNKCGKKGGSCPTICGKGGYCCKKGANTCPKYLADLNTLDAYACIRDPTEAVTTAVAPTGAATTAPPTEPYLVPNSKWCWNKCGKKGGSCPTICGKGGYCCKKGDNTCPKYLADLNTLGVYACIRDPTEAVTTIVAPTEPYLVPNSKCWNKCGSKGGSCPTFCGNGGYCCKKGKKSCPKYLADLNTLDVYACIRVPTARGVFEKCERQYIKKGCYHQSFIRDEKLLINDRDFNGTELEWYNFGPSIHSLACRCSDAARSSGYKFFSIRFWAECWGKTVSTVQVKKLNNAALKRKECANQNFEVCDDKDPAECVGKAWYDYLYQIKNI